MNNEESIVVYLWKCPRCGAEVLLTKTPFNSDDTHDKPICRCHPQGIYMEFKGDEALL